MLQNPKLSAPAVTLNISAFYRGRQVIHDAFFQNELQMTKGNTFRCTRPPLYHDNLAPQIEAITLALKSLPLHLELLVTIDHE